MEMLLLTLLSTYTLYMYMSHPLITLPVSTTYLMLGMVSDVSATLVATTHSLQLSGGGEKTYRKEGKINTYH